MRAAQCGLVGVSEPSTLSMASIKERAAALNLDEKLCVRPQGELLIAPHLLCVWKRPRRLHTFTGFYCLPVHNGHAVIASLSSPAHGVSIKSVQSSCVWNGLILHLRSSVAVKPRRLHLKSYSDCFLGSEAVDVLEAYMKGVKGLEGMNEEAAALPSYV